MVFNSVAFLVFFGLFFYLYWWINRKGSVSLRNLFLILASYLFYGWWDWRFLSLIFISSASDFLLGLLISRSAQPNRKKLFLILSLVINLGILGFFKYFNFFVESLEIFLASLGVSVNTYTLGIILPVGISFYTFQTLSYTIDIYRGQLQPTHNGLQFFAFVSFFPQLVAGPIERAKHFLPQFEDRKIFNRSQASAGLRLILWGFFKKIVIADNLAPIVDQIFAQPSQYSGIGILIGALAFAFQIYCDFSGYSDIAIGLGKTMGFELITNFRKPYFSQSFREFWQRWHISLSTWFRDYLYIPLGGNRVSAGRHNFNLMLTFVISGLWHGANFTFILWGFLHGIMLILENKLKFLRRIGWLWVLLIASLFWLPFRAQSTMHLKELTHALFQFNLNINWEGLAVFASFKMAALALVFGIFILLEWFSKNLNFNEYISQFNKPLRILCYYALLLAILFLGNFDVKPSFIYFQF